MQTVLVANRKGGVGKTLIAVTIASALANAGRRVALADADKQQSALDWLRRRPADVPVVVGLDWSRSGEIGNHPKKLDWLVIDAPGALRGAKAEDLIAQARAVLAPVQPGLFDLQATSAFLTDIDQIKRVRKGKVRTHTIANRIRRGSRAASELCASLADLDRPPIAEIAERAVYATLAADGTAIFDRRTKALEPIKAQWHPLLAELGIPEKA